MPRTNWAADQHLSAVSAFLNLTAYSVGVPLPSNPWFRLTGCSAWNVPFLLDDPNTPGVDIPPVPDWSLWQGPEQSVAAFMNALEQTISWTTIGVEEGIMGWANRPAYVGAPGSARIVSVIADWMLPYVSGKAYASQLARPRTLPPVWPGLDFVLLGDPVSIDTGVTIAGPMDGVIVELGEVPPERDYYIFDTHRSYLHIGSLAFADDNGSIEGFQQFTFSKQILTPTRLWQADACYLRADPFIVGTVTPWTVIIPGT